MILVDEYVKKFGEEPFLVIPFTYDSEPYPELLEKAIKRNKKLTKEEIEESLKDYIYDDESMFDSEVDYDDGL